MNCFVLDDLLGGISTPPQEGEISIWAGGMWHKGDQVYFVIDFTIGLFTET